MDSVASARARILGSLRPLVRERVSLTEAVGRVLAEPVVAPWPLPRFANSALDGYAVRASDIATASRNRPVRLRVVGESRAGGPLTTELTPGCAMAIMTGAPVPAGADAVVGIEDTDGSPGWTSLFAPVEPGVAVRPTGEDVQVGDEVLPSGRRLRPADLGIAAALGRAELDVIRRPRVGILSTGDELVPVGQEPGPGHIADSNSVVLAAAVVEAGGDPVVLGIARDSRADVRAHLVRAQGCDLILCTAGVSVGAHDWVRDVVIELGTLDLWRVAMRPGKPLAWGRVGTTPFLGLPGNPVSSQVTFELFARPAILALQGASVLFRPVTVAQTLHAMPKADGLETYLRGVRVPAPQQIPGVRLTGNQSSGAMSSMVVADCLVVLPAAGPGVEAGAIVEVIPLT